jgi:hypothetical protein
MDAISNEVDMHWRLRAIDNDTVCTLLHSIHDPGPFGDSNSGPGQSRISLPYHNYIMSTNNSGPDPSGNEANASENALILVNMNLTIYGPSRVGEKAMSRGCTMYLI